MKDNEYVKIKELLGRVYNVPPTPESQKRMEKERQRIMRELTRGVRSPLITLRLLLVIGVWLMAGLGCLFFYGEIVESVTMVYRYFAFQQPFTDEFVFNHLPYYLIMLLGVVETYQFGKDVL